MKRRKKDKRTKKRKSSKKENQRYVDESSVKLLSSRAFNLFAGERESISPVRSMTARVLPFIAIMKGSS